MRRIKSALGSVTPAGVGAGAGYGAGPGAGYGEGYGAGAGAGGVKIGLPRASNGAAFLKTPKQQ